MWHLLVASSVGTASLSYHGRLHMLRADTSRRPPILPDQTQHLHPRRHLTIRACSVPDSSDMAGTHRLIPKQLCRLDLGCPVQRLWQRVGEVGLEFDEAGDVLAGDGQGFLEFRTASVVSRCRS